MLTNRPGRLTVQVAALFTDLAALVMVAFACSGLASSLITNSGEAERAEWIANLDKVAALEPSIVVAGHRKVANDNAPKIIAESQQCLRDFSQIAAEETTATDIVPRMVERYPDWANGRTLWHSARTEIARKNG
jgi:hypothetical protein